MRFSRLLIPLSAAAVAAVCLLPGTASAAGTHTYNTNVCGRMYVPVNLGQGNYFNAYNAQAGNTCLSVQRKHLVFQVTSVNYLAKGWQYPGIGSGIHWGRYTCYDGPSAYPANPASQCMRYPVQQYKDGIPVTSARAWVPRGMVGNVSYDIWFNKTYTKPQETFQNNGTEIMIWLDYPGLRGYTAQTVRTVRVDGIAWHVMAWISHHNGTTWHYVAYMAVRQRTSVKNLWLNPFFREAEAHAELSRLWWLTGIFFGGEISHGGRGFDVSSYSLTGVN